MTAAEYAAHRGVSDSYVRRMRRKGNVVCDAGGRILVRASDALLDSVTNPVRGGKRTPGEPEPGALPTYTVPPSGVVSVQEAVRRERLARARLAELELGEQAGQLTRVPEVERLVFTLVRQALNTLQGQRHRLSMKLAAESDVSKVGDMLDEDVQLISSEMRKAAQQLLKPKAGSAPAQMPDAGDDSDEAEEDPEE